jgi:hypothetical protein
MSIKKLEAHTARALKALNKGEQVPSVVFLPPAQRTNKQRVAYAFNGNMPDVKANLVRIQDEADPIGLAIAIATGQPVATHTIDEEGNVKTKYETLPLTSPLRERMIRWLGDKVQPRLSMRKTRTTKNGNTEDKDEWEALTGAAAERDDEKD